MQKNDDYLFEVAASEISTQNFVKGIMARAYSDALGDKDRTTALYIKYRVANLRNERDQEEKKRRQADEQDRMQMKNLLMTICKKCDYAGSMKRSFFHFAGHVPFSIPCKCPKCLHRFDWYYIPSKDMPQAQS